MSKYIILYNSMAGNGKGRELAETLNNVLKGEELVFNDIIEVSKDYPSFFASLDDDCKVVLCGGDGTLNRFANDIDGIELTREVLYFPCGSGNDFIRDIGGAALGMPVSIGNYLTDLPTVEINGKKTRFINGIGYGIDGYCCEEGDKLREKSDEDINYAGIAIKGLLFHFKPANAVITVDGVKHEYKKVWLAPCMNGRFYGGGMMPTPEQDRLDSEKKLSVLVWHGSGKIPTLAAFPGIFKGEHVKHKKMCEVLCGKEITVEFDKPTPAQIDGETVLNVSSYKATSASLVKA